MGERAADGSVVVGSAADVDGGGDLVLDQLVSGLLATPCIRRRLDQLYGKAPASKGGASSGGGALGGAGSVATPALGGARALLKLPPPPPVPESY